MRRIVGLGIVAVVCVGLYMVRQVAASGSGTVKSFTATIHEVRFRPDGTAGHEEKYIVAFRADGSSVIDHLHTLPSGQTTEVKLIEDVGSGHQVTVDYATQSTSTYPLPSNYSATISKQASACSAAAAASSESPILGYQVVLVHDAHTYRNGASNRHDRWEAPDLNCFPLRSIDFATRQPGVKAPHNETEAINVGLGEPDPAMFSIPQNFVERSPSERHAEFKRRFGINAPTPPQTDQEYFSERQRLK